MVHHVSGVLNGASCIRIMYTYTGQLCMHAELTCVHGVSSAWYFCVHGVWRGGEEAIKGFRRSPYYRHAHITIFRRPCFNLQHKPVVSSIASGGSSPSWHHHRITDVDTYPNQPSLHSVVPSQPQNWVAVGMCFMVIIKYLLNISMLYI